MRRNRESSEKETLEEVNRVIEETEAQQERRQDKLRAKAKKLLSWFSEWRNRRRYSEWLQIKQGELMMQTLELQILSLKGELKDYREMKKLDRHVHKWKHRRGYVD